MSPPTGLFETTVDVVMTPSSNHNPNDADLRRLLSQAIGPDELTDARIEQLLADTSAIEMDDRQATRILTSTDQLIHESQQLAPTNRLRKRRNNTTRPTEIVMKRIVDNSNPQPKQRGAVIALAVASLSLVTVLIATASHSLDTKSQHAVQKQQHEETVRSDWMTARTLSPAPIERVQVGRTVRTGSEERRRLALPDGSILYVNTGTSALVESPRHVHVSKGEVFVEVVPQFDGKQRTPFEITTPQRTVTALGTKFSVAAHPEQTDVLVTQGKVKVSGQPAVLKAGQQLTARGDSQSPTTIESSPRASAALNWTRDLICAAGSILPPSQYSGGAIITVDPSGQEIELSLRKYHVDVHIEDGFARTTIDQTYFNHTSSRLEGTFHFPLPADASLSRLAMYVNGKLMEGGMAERQHARNTFEHIVSKMKDPALLEWVDGSTFKMRVFPLESRQEKRIILSYTQRLNTAYGRTSYRFPAGHNMDVVRDWSAQVRVKDGSYARWSSPSHPMTSSVELDDLLLESAETNSRMDRDLVLELKTEELNEGDAAWSTAEHEGHRYLMLRHRPELPAEANQQQRNWIILFEASADRDPLLARTQIEVIRTLLDNAEHTDTFSIVAANTKAETFKKQAVACTASNIEDAIRFLERTHLIGALDLKRAFVKSANFVSDQDVENILVHTGSALPVLGEHRQHALLKKLPKHTAYVGVGVGNRWSRSFMKQAASTTGGYFAQINPDEDVAWRAFELSSTLNAPRLLDMNITADAAADAQPFHTFTDTVVHGEEICAVMRLERDAPLPKSVTLNGTLKQQPWQKKVAVRHVQVDATYLPRTWAKLAIDSWVATNAAAHKDDIIALSKSMYVMSPYTSLLVLENEAMYAQYGIDRGRKDHWALYPCPDEIAVVHEPVGRGDAPRATDHSDETTRLLKTITSLHPPTPQSDTSHMRREMGSPYWLRLSGVYGPPTAVGTGSLPWGMPINQHEIGLHLVSSSDNTRSFGWTPRFSQPTGESMDALVRSRVQPIDSELQEFELRNGPSAGPVPVTVRRQLAETVQLSLDFSLHDHLQPLPHLGAVPQPVRKGLHVINGPPSDAWQFHPQQPNSAAVTYPPRYNDIVSPNIGPFYPYQQVPRGWRDARLQWDDGFWHLNFNKEPNAWQTLFESSSMKLRQNLTQLNGVEQSFAALQPVTGRNWSALSDRWWRRRSIQEDPRWKQNVSLHLHDVPLFDVLRHLSQTYGVAILPEIVLRHPSDVRLLKKVNINVDNIQLRSVVNLLLRQAFPEFQIGGTYHDLPQRLSNGLVRTTTLCDLISHAPGMNTTYADVLHVLDTVSNDRTPAKRGNVDPEATTPINLARSAQWETVTLPTPDNEPPLTVTCNGEGHYAWTRIVSEGLEEQVVCDGDTLLHLYPEIGLGARRTHSHFHAETIRSLIPWLLPSVEELALSFDIVKVDDNTVGLIPLMAENRAAVEVEPTDEQNNDATPQKSEMMIHLVFRNGRVVEKQAVDQASGNILQTLKFTEDGKITLLDQDGNVITEQQWKRQACDAPNLKPSLEDLVVLPLPYRTVTFDSKSDDPLHKLASHFAEGHERKVVQIIGDDFFAKGDRREGFYVLLSRSPRFLTGEHTDPNTDGRIISFDLRPPAEGSALQQFVRQWVNLQVDYSDAKELDIAAPEESFLHRIATARNLIARWKGGIATNDRTQSQIQTELELALTFIASCKSDQLGWSVLSAVHSSLPIDKFGEEFAAAAKRFEQHGGLKFFVRQERSRSLFQAGHTEKARRIVRRMLRDQIEAHGLPYLDAELRNFYVSNNGQKSWDRVIHSAGQQLIESQQLRTAIWFSEQLKAQGDSQLAEDLVTEVLAVIEIDKRPEIAILASRSLQQISSGSANDLIDRVLEVESMQESAELWRYASEVADPAGQKQTALKRLEKAVLLEFEQQTDVVNLKTIRASYSKLMNKFEEIIDAAATLQLPPPEELVARIVRAADQWRSIDDDDTQCCRMTAELLRKLNRRDLAWAYLTSPLAGRAGESGSWKTLAEELIKANELALADIAWERAYDLQQTNPDLLLKHAEMHRTQGNKRKSQRLLRQIINGNWQPRFSSTVQRAREMVQ